jgi:Xaa-Pro aminopeptidase
MFRNPFSDEEIAVRLARLRSRLAERNVDLAIISAPENVFYLIGLDHWGYFAPHLLILPIDGEPILVTRAMEQVTIERQVRNAQFRGHSDDETAAEIATRIIAEMPSRARIGIERFAAGMSHGAAITLSEKIDAAWIDITGLVDNLRLVKSPAEQELIRQAAHVSDEAMEAAIDAICEGAPEREVAAACLAAMTRAGGEPPGFGPFIRPTSRLGEEHTTWGDGSFRAGEPVFLELSGCIARYHAPLGRLVHVGLLSDEDASMAEIATRAFAAVVETLRPGATAGQAYKTWQDIVDDAGLSHYRRHHCGYAVGIGCPPSWTGGNSVLGLKAQSDLVLEAGMSFHVLSWLMGTGKGNYFISNPVLISADETQVLTRTPFGPVVK